jgi:hypothetical protein
MAVTQYLREDTNPVFAPVATASAVAIGDFCALVGGEVVPANDFTWAGSKAATQYNFVAALLGHCFQLKDASTDQVYGNSTANIIGVSTTGTYAIDLQSATTLVVGDYIGLAKNASANELLPQVGEKVAALSSAIGVCVKAGTLLERCEVRLLPTVVPLAPAPATTTSTSSTPTSTSTTT